MASQEHTPGGVLLWKGDSATQLAESLADMAQHADVLGAIDPFDYPGFLQATLASETYRAPYGLHPRLHILSPIEARMQQFDVVILGGLNEGVWPELTNTDPWMSRPMREAFGLQALERSIGQSAHDFYSLCHAPDVLITRSRKVSGAPAIASRWLIRIMTLLDGKDKPLLMALDETAYYEEAKSQLDTPALLAPLNRPAPCPPIAARPNRMRLTAVDAWVRDPYMVYAKYVLGLEKLEPLDQDPSAADLGTLIHKALENFVRDHPKDIPQDGYTKLLAIGKEVFAVYANRPAMAMVWWPRFEAIAQWFIEREKEIRASTKHVHVEKKGELQISTGDDTFTLTTRIDRIEIANDNTATIADYKTGSIPSDSDIKQGLSNQLALEALIATHGKVEGYIPNPGTPRLCYWKLAANPAQAEIKEIAADLEATRQRLESLIRDYANPNMPYAAQSNPALLPRYNDYEHLTRRQEWGMV